MRMRFEPEDDDAFLARRDELGERFATWLATQKVAGDPNDAGLLMDWKWGYADGSLDRWRVGDVSEFLLEWCPRTLSADPSIIAEIPGSVAAFVEFLAHEGLLRGGDPPSAIRRFCVDNTGRFVREMGDLANHGPAKILVGGVALDDDPAPFGGLLADGDASEVPWIDGEQPQVGPVRLPTDAERRASACTAPMLATVRAFAEYAADPGRTLTPKGNLRLADARHLVDALATGDERFLDGFRRLTTAEELPGLDRILHLSLDAGAVRRHRGKLVAVARFARLDDLAAHEKIVTAAFEQGFGPRWSYGFVHHLNALVDSCLPALLSPLLTGTEMEIDELDDAVGELLAEAAPSLSGMLDAGHLLRERLDGLAGLGLVRLRDEVVAPCADCAESHRSGGHVGLTAAGVHVLVEQAREAGAEVLTRPDPAEAGAAEILDLGGRIDEQEWIRDVRSWFAARADPAAATVELADAVLAEQRDPFGVVAGLGMVAELGGEHADDAVRRHLDGPHDGLVVHWLLNRSAIDPTTVDPGRVLGALTDILAATLDGGGPDELVALMHDGSAEQQLEMLDAVWRLDHPRLPDVLDTLGREHPDGTVAEAARKAAVRHRSLLAGR